MAANESYMRLALELAKEAEQQGEVPVGAVVVIDNKVVGQGYNQTILLSDPTAHAEVIALRQAAKRVGNYRLNGAHLYSTLEPCPMCAGALVHARIEKLFFAASDPRTGACVSQFQLTNHSALNHKVVHDQGLFAAESADLLRSFFKKRR